MTDTKIKRFEEIAQILCRCEQLKTDILSYSGKNVQIYRKVFTTELLGRTNVYFFQLYVLQLCMVLHKKEHHHLRTLATDLLNDPNTNWHNVNSKSQVTNILFSLQAIEDRIVPTLKGLRDKFIAHRDVDRELEQATLTYTDAWGVLAELQEIYNIINHHAFGKTLLFETLMDREPSELRHLARYSSVWAKLRPEFAKPHDGLLRDLIYLIRGKTPPNQ